MYEIILKINAMKQQHDCFQSPLSNDKIPSDKISGDLPSSIDYFF